MSSDEAIFDDDADVTPQNCRFIPRYLEYNQVPFVYASLYGLSPFTHLHTTLSHTLIPLIDC